MEIYYSITINIICWVPGKDVNGRVCGILWNTFFHNYLCGIELPRIDEMPVDTNISVFDYVCLSSYVIFAKVQTYKGMRLITINEALVCLKLTLLKKKISLKMSVKIYTLIRNPLKPFRIPVPRLRSIISTGKDSCGV
jgi:hypothetical protein